MATCRSPKCGAEIVFARTAHKNKPMPVDPQPHPDGNVRLTERSNGIRTWWEAEVLGPLEVALAEGEELFIAHWVTCKDPEAFR